MASLHVHVIRVMAQLTPSIPIPFPPSPPPPPGYLSDVCHFVLEKLQMPHGGARRSYKNLMMGPKNRVQMPYCRTKPKLRFPVKKLQIPYLRETCNNLIRQYNNNTIQYNTLLTTPHRLAPEAPYTNCF